MTTTASIVQGAELPSITRTWLDDDGAAVDLTTYALTLRIGTNPPIEKTTGVTGDANGLVTIAWAVGELDAVTPGPYSAQVWARNGSNQDRVMPLGLTVLPQVPLPA